MERRNGSSKKAQGLQNVKYSILLYPKNPKVGPNCRAKKGTLWDFKKIHSVAKYQKKLRGHYGDI